MLIRTYIEQLSGQLQSLYDEREACNIARYLLEEKLGKETVRSNGQLSREQLDMFQTLAARLLKSEPIQYVLGEAWFYGRPFLVNRNVLIPRPETEELCEWVIRENQSKLPRMLDIGTGSGCIAVTLSAEIPNAQVTAIDISERALQVAADNATRHQQAIQFILGDILDDNRDWSALPALDLIVSNPPYVDPALSAQLHTNVLHFEPHLALFGPASDPLLFYKRIADFAVKRLASGGILYLELPETDPLIIQTILDEAGLTDIRLQNDLQGKPRMMAAARS